MRRFATAIWNGSGKSGTGRISTQSTVLDNVQYSFNSRFADGIGTNPEELLAASHSGCFTMKLSLLLEAAGFVPENIETVSHINFENGAITESHLVVKASVPGIGKQAFDECVKNAELNCPVSRALAITIRVDSSLQ